MKKPKNISAAKVEKLLEKFTPEHAQRLRELFALWKNPAGGKTLSRWQCQELRAAGLIRDENGTVGTEAEPPGDAPKYCNGTQLAALLTKTFGKFVSPVAISRALRRAGMCGRQSNGSWLVSEATEWWKLNKVDRGERVASLQERADVAEMEKKISDARRAKLELENREKETSDRWTLTTEAIAGAIGALQKLRGFFRTAADRRFGAATVAELRARGFTDEQLAVVGEVCSQVGRDIVREVEQEAAKAVAEKSSQLPVQ